MITLADAEREYASVMAHIRSLDKPSILWQISPRVNRARSCTGHNWYEIFKIGIQFIVCSKCNMMISPNEEGNNS